jgi:3-(3-hydroxy-phenyl)propionate hydroxylase
MWRKGQTGVVNDLINWAEGRMLLLVFGPQSQADLKRLRTLTEGTPLRCVQVLSGTAPQAREHVLDSGHKLRSACHLNGDGWALVRPDGYLAAQGQRVNGDLLKAISDSLAL